MLRVLVGKDNDDVKDIVSKLKKKNESIAEFIIRSKDSIALGTPEEVSEYLQQYRKNWNKLLYCQLYRIIEIT